MCSNSKWFDIKLLVNIYGPTTHNKQKMIHIKKQGHIKGTWSSSQQVVASWEEYGSEDTGSP